MRMALRLAVENPRNPFGAVIVHGVTGAVLAEGRNRTEESPVLHAEIDAINRCSGLLPTPPWEVLDLYTTAEPCPMCQSALCYAGFRTVYFGSSVAFLRNRGWRQFDLTAETVVASAPWTRCSVVGAILESECDAVFAKARPLLSEVTGGGP